MSTIASALRVSSRASLLRHQGTANSLRRITTDGRPRTAILFPGQGVQKVGMLDPFIRAFPSTVRPLLDEIDAHLALKVPLTNVIRDGPAASLTASENSQGAIFITSMVIYNILKRDFNFSIEKSVDYILGHSLGEFAALVAAENLSLYDGLNLVHLRGQMMAECSHRAESGEPPPNPFTPSYHYPMDPITLSKATLGMVAVLSLPERQPSMLATINELLLLPPDRSPLPKDNLVQIGNLNSPTQIVLSGHLRGISTVLSHVQAWGGYDPQAVRLNIASPFHTTIMKPAEDLVRTMIAEKNMVRFPGIKPVVSNISARPFRDAEDVTDLVARQATETVNWADSIRYIREEGKVTRYIALGPGRVGAKLISSSVNSSDQILQVAEPRDFEKLIKALENDG